jgi:hypothetical protein
MMISNAISTTMMTSRRSDRFVLMMSVNIFAVSEMKDRQVLNAGTGITGWKWRDCAKGEGNSCYLDDAFGAKDAIYSAE